jgi:hypothetical protein
LPEDGALKLVPIGFAMSGTFDSLLYADYNYRLMWEWWDRNAGDGPCLSVAPETEHAGGGGNERHCVEGGGRQFMFTGPGPSGPRTFPVDYMASTASAYDPLLGTYANVASHTPMSTAMDLVIQSDISSTDYSSGEQAILHLDSTTSLSSTFAAGTTASGDSTTLFRFRTYQSSTTWSPSDTDFASPRGLFLARLYVRANPDTTWEPLTGYYNSVGDEGNVLRYATFAGPGSCPGSRTYTIGVEVLSPNEYPANAPASDTSAQRTITVACGGGGGGGGVTAPTDVGATNVSYTTARVTWDNGTTASGTTTTVEVNSGGGWTTAASGISAGVDYVDISGLTPGTTYDVRVRHSLGGNHSSWAETTSGLFATSAVTAPTGLSVGNPTASTADASWTNTVSVTGTTTEVQTRPSGGTWTSHGPAGAGVTTLQLTGLTHSTEYEVRIRHSLGGVTSSWVTEEFETDEPDVAITSFGAVSCYRFYSASKWRITWDLAWTVSGSASGLQWEVLESTTSSTGDGTVIASNTTGTSMTTGVFLEINHPLTRYYFVRYTGVTGWFALDPASLVTTECVAF